MDENQSNSGNDEALLRELALRLAAQRSGPGADPQLLVGQLPDHLPFEMPIPAGARIIGSLASDAQHMDIVLDAPLSREQVSAFYQERMRGAGWSEVEQPAASMGGFAPASGPAHARLSRRIGSGFFCKGPNGPSLQVLVQAEQAGFSDVRLNLNLDPHNSLCAQQRHWIGAAGAGPLVPQLTPSAGAQQWPGGGGGGSDQFYSSATLEADADIATLSAHYAGQLEQGGWTRLDAGQSGPSAWHTWMLQDESGQAWYGTFCMLRKPGGAGSYFLLLRIEPANRRQPRGGWFSFHRLS